MSNKFDFSGDIDSAVSTAKELELTEKLTEIVEDYMAAVHELNTGTGLLVRVFSPLIPALDTTVKAVKEATIVTVSGRARELLEQGYSTSLKSGANILSGA